jgi:hypothetical protein
MSQNMSVIWQRCAEPGRSAAASVFFGSRIWIAVTICRSRFQSPASCARRASPNRPPMCSAIGSAASGSPVCCDSVISLAPRRSIAQAYFDFLSTTTRRLASTRGRGPFATYTAPL